MTIVRSIAYAIIPLLILIFFSCIAVIIGFVIIQFAPDLSFEKIINKTTQVFLVLSIFPAMTYFKLNRETLGFAEKALFFKQLLQGFALGIISLLPVFIILYQLRINVIDTTQPWTLLWLFEKTSIALLLALLISLIEEPLFRGILLLALVRKLPLTAALIISASYYAALHFIKSKTVISFQDIHFLSGFQLMCEAFANILNPDIFSAFIALFMVGLFLGLIRTQIKTSLGLCIGCHTAWVWQIKLNKTFFNTDFHADYAYLVSSYDGVIGPMVSGWLLVFSLGYVVLIRHKYLHKS